MILRIKPSLEKFPVIMVRSFWTSVKDILPEWRFSQNAPVCILSEKSSQKSASHTIEYAGSSRRDSSNNIIRSASDHCMTCSSIWYIFPRES
jgi:hypothetical protein